MRLEGWENRFAAFIEEAHNREFRWGEWDCCLMACDAIKALIGKDPAADGRGKYDSELGAARIIRQRGGIAKIAERGVKKFGFKAIAQLFAQRGDIALAVVDGLETLGVCTGRTFAFPQIPKGLAHYTLDSSEIVKVWRVE